MLAALAGWVGLAQPAFALDKVKFALNWLADPEEGGFFQAAADGTYAMYGLDVTIIPAARRLTARCCCCLAGSNSSWAAT